LDAKLTTQLCKEITAAKSNEMKARCSLIHNGKDKWGRIFYGRLWKKGAVFQ
jgi:hypothetical protein